MQMEGNLVIVNTQMEVNGVSKKPTVTLKQNSMEPVIEELDREGPIDNRPSTD